MASIVSFMGSAWVPSILSNAREFMADIWKINMWSRREECVALHLSLNHPGSGDGTQSKISLFAKRT